MHNPMQCAGQEVGNGCCRCGHVVHLLVQPHTNLKAGVLIWLPRVAGSCALRNPIDVSKGKVNGIYLYRKLLSVRVHSYIRNLKGSSHLQELKG